jgi:hypothetical protein
MSDTEEVRRMGQQFIDFMIKKGFSIPVATAAMVEAAGECMGQMAVSGKASEEDFERGLKKTIGVLENAARRSYDHWNQPRWW